MAARLNQNGRKQMIKVMTTYFIILVAFTFHLASVSAEEMSNLPLFKLKGEVLEVEELKEPLGSAIYTIKDLSSGETVKLLADRYRSLIKINDAIKPAGDVLGGSKVIIIYQKSENQKMPEIVFAKVTNLYA